MTKFFNSKHAEIYLNNVLAYVPGSIYWKDKYGVYLGCNQTQVDMAGFLSPTDMIGKTDYELPWREIADSLKETDQRIMRTGMPEELIEKPVLADGQELIMLTKKSPLYDEFNNIIGIIGVSLDITERIKTEERERVALAEIALAETNRKIAEETKRAIMVLAGSIAHDLRTPLFCIGAVNHMLKSCLPVLLQHYENTKEFDRSNIARILSSKKLENVEQILNEAKKIDYYVNDMNSFITQNLKSIANGNLDFLEPKDLVECNSYRSINQAMESYPFNNEQKTLINWQKNYYFTFMGNPILFVRIIFNLLDNALQQIQTNGRGEIFISTEEQANYNLMRFRDTAGGAAPEIVERIFDGYYTTKKHGTGIGLAFCRLTMQSFGGDIECSAIENEYIEFVLKFPKIIV